MRIEKTKKGFNRLIWDNEDIQWLESHYAYMTNDDIARHFGCSSPSVSLKGRELGLVKKHGLKYHKFEFTEEELQYIRDHYPTDAQCEIAEHFHVSPPVIHRVALELGLKKADGHNRKQYYYHIVKNYKHERYANIVR